MKEGKQGEGATATPKRKPQKVPRARTHAGHAVHACAHAHDARARPHIKSTRSRSRTPLKRPHVHAHARALTLPLLRSLASKRCLLSACFDDFPSLKILRFPLPADLSIIPRFDPTSLSESASTTAESGDAATATASSAHSSGSGLSPPPPSSKGTLDDIRKRRRQKRCTSDLSHRATASTPSHAQSNRF